MAEAQPTLDDLRRQIDEIDVTLQELIVRRAEVVTQVGALKNRISGGARVVHMRPAREALGAVFDGEASVAVLPMPQSTDGDHWWRLLLSRDAKAPRIVARLPFGARGSERDAPVEALVVGPVVPEASGLDRSLIAVETAAELSR